MHDKQNLRLALVGLGRLALEEGNHTSAGALLQEGLAVARELNDPWWESYALVLLGELARVRGRYARARIMLAEGVTLGREAGALAPVVTAIWYQGRLAQGEGDPEAAGRLFAEALSMADLPPVAQTRGSQRVVAGCFWTGAVSRKPWATSTPPEPASTRPPTATGLAHLMGTSADEELEGQSGELICVSAAALAGSQH
jgi:tetratricopeptide (TPR) repeat protein